MMRRLMSLVLILAVLSITPASVYVCGAVTAPEIILHLRDGHEPSVDINCSPTTAVLVSSMTFSNFLQSGFFAVAATTAFFFSFQSCLFENNFVQKYGLTILPLTPPPNIS